MFLWMTFSGLKRIKANPLVNPARPQTKKTRRPVEGIRFSYEQNHGKIV